MLEVCIAARRGIKVGDVQVDQLAAGTFSVDHSEGGTGSRRRQRTVIGSLPSQDTKSTSPQ